MTDWWITSLRHEMPLFVSMFPVRSTRRRVHPKQIIVIFVVHITSVFQCELSIAFQVFSTEQIWSECSASTMEIARLDCFQLWPLKSIISLRQTKSLYTCKYYPQQQPAKTYREFRWSRSRYYDVRLGSAMMWWIFMDAHAVAVKRSLPEPICGLWFDDCDDGGWLFMHEVFCAKRDINFRTCFKSSAKKIACGFRTQQHWLYTNIDYNNIFLLVLGINNIVMKAYHTFSCILLFCIHSNHITSNLGYLFLFCNRIFVLN